MSIRLQFLPALWSHYAASIFVMFRQRNCVTLTMKLYVVLTILKTIAETNIRSKLENYNTLVILVRCIYSTIIYFPRKALFH